MCLQKLCVAIVMSSSPTVQADLYNVDWNRLLMCELQFVSRTVLGCCVHYTKLILVLRV